jgi:uncharacterized membrane protein (UPF0127 family)
LVHRWFCFLTLLTACSGGGDPAPTTTGSDLAGFAVDRITVNGQEIEVWLATTGGQQAQGFIFAAEEQLAPLPDGTPRGMLFVFADDRFRTFWMRDTYVPLDLAYIRADGTIVDIHELIPLDETLIGSSVPVRYALEVRAGTLAAMGVAEGDVVTVP